MHRIIVTMPPDLLQQVEEMAARFSLNRSQFIRHVLQPAHLWMHEEQAGMR